MAMKRRRARVRQEQLWTPTASLPISASHPFYARLNGVLDEKKFDEFAGQSVSRFTPKRWASGTVAWNLLSVAHGGLLRGHRFGTWHRLASQRQLSIRSFVRIALDETIPDHSTISRT